MRMHRLDFPREPAAVGSFHGAGDGRDTVRAVEREVVREDEIDRRDGIRVVDDRIHGLECGVVIHDDILAPLWALKHPSGR